MTSSFETDLYLGSYTQAHPFVPEARGEGILVCDFDPHTGKLQRRQRVGGILNPACLALDDTGAHVLAVSENFDATGAVHAYRRQPDGRLSAAGAQPAEGRTMCHVCAMPGGWVCATSYMDGKLAVFRFRGGMIGPCEKSFCYEGKSVNASRQESSHAHQAVISPDARWLYVCDLGADRIWAHVFDHDKGGITPPSPESVATPAGSGPRHLVFHPSVPRAYVICELTAHLLTYDWEASTGRLTLIDNQPSLPREWHGEPAAAAIRLHSSAKALYVSNRNHDSLTAFRLDHEGGATFAACIPSAGKTPRDFAFEPSGRWLLAANQDSDSVAVHEIDPGSGLPSMRPPGVTPVATPVSVLFASPPPKSL